MKLLMEEAGAAEAVPEAIRLAGHVTLPVPMAVALAGAVGVITVLLLALDIAHLMAVHTVV